MQTRQKRKAVGSNPSDGPMLLSDLPEEILYYIVRFHVWAKMNHEGCVIKSEDTWNHLGEIKVRIANMDTVRPVAPVMQRTLVRRRHEGGFRHTWHRRLSHWPV